MSVLDNTRLHLVETLDEVWDFMRWLGERRPVLALDIETSGLSLAKDRIRLVQFGDGAHGWAIPYEEWRGVIRDALSKYDRPLVLQHAKFDASFLLRDGLPFPWPHVHDTMFMSFLVNSLGPKSLKPAAALYVDPTARAGEAELKRAMQANRWDYSTIPVNLPAYWGYSAADTVLTALLAERLWPRVQPYREAYELELACERVLCDMQLRGVPIDVPYCRSTAAHLEEDLQALREQFPFNPNAPAEVAAALQAEGVTLQKHTATGDLAVDKDVLTGVDNKLAHDVLWYRENAKVLSSYLRPFLNQHRDGRVHPHINQIAARTGRMSVTEPALQTLPRRSVVRDAVVPSSEDNVLALVDYSAQEMRILASVSGDEQLIEDFANGVDPHMQTALGAYGPNAGKAERTLCKNGNFSRIYGAGEEKIAWTAGVPVATIRKVFEVFDARYPKAANKLMADITRAVRERAVLARSDYGYVTLSSGHRLKVPVAKAYTGTNYRIQGEGAVVVKRALVDLDAAGFGPYLLLPVHDEIVFDLPKAEVDAALPEIQQVMTRTEYRVPLTVEAKTVARWGDAYREEVQAA